MQPVRTDRIIRHTARSRAVVLSALMAVLLAACGGGEEAAPAPGNNGPGAQNAAPTLSGSATTTATVGTAYSFQPSAQDPENATLSFSIQNKPSWATFSTATGALTGTPAAGNTGTTSNIVISVSDGTNTVSLAAFSITVTQVPTPTATARVDWSAPTTNTDGSAADVAGFRIYYGSSAAAMTSSVNVPGTAVRSYTLASLVPGTYYFSVAAYTAGGVESAQSTPVAATVQ
jgi:hypothetical protein